MGAACGFYLLTPLTEGTITSAALVQNSISKLRSIGTVPYSGKDATEFLLGQDSLKRVPLATGMVQAFAAGHHKGIVEAFVLLEHGLIGTHHQSLKRFTVAVYHLVVPENSLVWLPGLLAGLLGISALHLAYLELLSPFIVLEGLQESLHAVAVYSVIDEGIAAQIGKCLSWVSAIGPYIHGSSGLT